MKTTTKQQITEFVFTYSPIAVMAIMLMIAGCSTAGERAAEMCTDARLSPGTPAFESCVLQRLPSE